MADAFPATNVYVFRVMVGHEIALSREDESSDWYIRVRGPNGCYVYDGWWRDSAGKSWQAALEEAKRGADLFKHGARPAKERTPAREKLCANERECTHMSLCSRAGRCLRVDPLISSTPKGQT